MSIQKALRNLQYSPSFWFLLLSSFVFFLLRLPSFFEPYWYGDEGIYEVIGYALRHGRFLYQGIWDNKPPLLYVIYALGSGDQMVAKVLSFVAGLIALWIFFLLTKKLFSQKTSLFLSVGLLTVLLGLPLLEGNIANAENFMVLPSIGAAACIATILVNKLHLLSKQAILLTAVAGLLLGLSFLTKVVAVFDAAALSVILAFVFLNRKTLIQYLLTLVIFGACFFIPLFLTILFYLSHGQLTTFLHSTFFSNIGYVNYGNQFIIPQGLLIFKLLLLLGFIGLLFWKKHLFSFPHVFIGIWVAFSIFSALFSERPYTHYVIIILPSLCLLAGLLHEKQAKVIRFLSLGVLVGVVIFIAQYFWIYSKTVGYYANFVSYVSGKEGTTAYQRFFDRNVPRDYSLAEYLRTHMKKSDTVFIWGNSAQIYKLANTLPPGRYTVAYHITLTNQTAYETELALKQKQPKFVIILPDAPAYPYPMTGYVQQIGIDKALIYERIF